MTGRKPKYHFSALIGLESLSKEQQAILLGCSTSTVAKLRRDYISFLQGPLELGNEADE